jgi:lipopolysaccharide/colanic/teichoic acid biosynthesis glycosyltransferase
VAGTILGIKSGLESNKPFLMAQHESSEILPEAIFSRLLSLERKRTERSGRYFVLMILDPGDLLLEFGDRLLPQLTVALKLSTRDTDIKGWWSQKNPVIAVIYTEIAAVNAQAVISVISDKVGASLRNTLSPEQVERIRVTFQVFPADWESDGPNGSDASGSLRDTSSVKKSTVPLLAKRSIDMLGSIAGLIIFLPIMAVIAVVIKVTSKGPVLFRQERFGRYGKKFLFLKFRSMYVDTDHSIHEQYINQFIKGEVGAVGDDGKERKLYKLVDDPRITPVGRILRKTSLDELPQFLNVLRGEMSLVGPRPPLPYEVRRYDLWHKQRLMVVKPGITGLWQVEGRSRVAFDEMVRLDIRYARSWSLWLDIKILLKTPRAVLSGAGAH